MTELQHYRATTWAGELRTEKVSQRIVTARLVPYGVTSYDVPDPRGERFLKGSLTRSLDHWANSRKPLKLFTNHDHSEAVGLATAYDPHAEGGPVVDFRLANTPKADQALDHMTQGLLDSVSVGFLAVRERRGRDGAREVQEARLGEVSLAPLGAYEGADVLALREPSRPVLDLSGLKLGEAPAYDPDLPLWSGLR